MAVDADSRTPAETDEALGRRDVERLASKLGRRRVVRVVVGRSAEGRAAATGTGRRGHAGRDAVALQGQQQAAREAGIAPRALDRRPQVPRGRRRCVTRAHLVTHDRTRPENRRYACDCASKGVEGKSAEQDTKIFPWPRNPSHNVESVAFFLPHPSLCFVALIDRSSSQQSDHLRRASLSISLSIHGRTGMAPSLSVCRVYPAGCRATTNGYFGVFAPPSTNLWRPEAGITHDLFHSPIPPDTPPNRTGRARPPQRRTNVEPDADRRRTSGTGARRHVRRPTAHARRQASWNAPTRTPAVDAGGRTLTRCMKRRQPKQTSCPSCGISCVCVRVVECE